MMTPEKVRLRRDNEHKLRLNDDENGPFTRMAEELGVPPAVLARMAVLSMMAARMTSLDPKP